ncbi:hypothetical protein C7M84_009194 [Penaeus vannamei]|uniref:DUF4706 domain-containing protein n=1 Tax=Penaeus vannamei TaxID=6689 RepID=A0A423T7K8_PENVA|nr:hypothetical protein C7M84_009194 [Penaeus vannamei]
MPAPPSTENLHSRGPPHALSVEVSPPEEYFRGVSPLCRKMLDDMTAVREKWGDTWNELSYQQQCRVIDQAMVDEATVRRYEAGEHRGACEEPECEYFPKLKLPTGQKVVCDENLTARGFGRVIPGGRAVYTARPVSLPRPPRFRWHYDPPGSPDPPSVVVAAPRSATLPSNLNREARRANTSKYMLIRNKADGGEGGGGILAKIRGAVAALTATCLPLKATSGQNSLLSLYNAPKEGGEPELRPPHVRVQATEPKDPQAPSGQVPGPADANGNPGGFANNPLSDLASDPALVGYYCTLPDEDDDDAPYTPRAALLPERTKVTVNTPVTPELEASYRQIPDGAPARLSSEGPSTETISSAFTSPLSACLPTPEPACVLRRPREKNPSPELSEKEHDLLEEFNINLELSASEKRESNIPKTGFDFLDNW